VKTLRDRMEYAARHAGLTPGQVDRQMDEPRGWFRGLLSDNGNLEDLSDDMLDLLANLFGVSTSWLVEGKVSTDAEMAIARIDEMASKTSISPADLAKLKASLETL
jgi:hypothetical protein